MSRTTAPARRGGRAVALLVAGLLLSACSPGASFTTTTTTPTAAGAPRTSTSSAPTSSAHTTTAPPTTPSGGPASGPETVEAVFLGDSYTVGTGDPDGSGYVLDVAAAMGWVSIGQGQGGTGYVNPGGAGEPYGSRLAEVVAADPDVVLVQGSTNDVGSPPGAVESAALDLYTALRTALPRARVVVVGPVAAPVVADQVGPVRDAVARAASRAGVDFLDPIASRWIESPIWFGDGLHPDDAGYRAFAGDLVAGLRSLGL